MLDQITSILESKLPRELVKQILESYHQIKRNYFLGNLRPNELEGGRFSEAIFRVLEFTTTNKYTPLSQGISGFLQKCSDFEKLPKTSFSDSIRIHIPRTIRLLYDIRNKRDVAHLTDGIDPNLQDATFVVSASDWIVAELIREFHNIKADEAHNIVDKLVSRKIPAIEEFGDFLKTLKPDLKVSERILIILYQKGDGGATSEQLKKWIKPDQVNNLNRTLYDMNHNKDLIVKLETELYKITKLGIKQVEEKKLLEI